MCAKTLISQPERRRFLLKGLPVIGMCCFGGLNELAHAQPVADSIFEEPKHKFLEDSGMSYKEVFDFAFKRRFIESMKIFSETMGKEKLLGMLAEASADAGAKATKEQIKNLPQTNFAMFKAGTKMLDRFWRHVVTMKPFAETKTSYEVRVTECLWAQTFIEEDAADIGYATHCHVDYATATAFNPNIRMYRTKTLMEGHDYCDHKWVWEG
jgi:hypothetical protein